MRKQSMRKENYKNYKKEDNKLIWELCTSKQNNKIKMGY